MVKLLKMLEVIRRQKNVPLIVKTLNGEIDDGQGLGPDFFDHVIEHLKPMVFKSFDMSDFEKTKFYLQGLNHEAPTNKKGYPILTNAPFKIFSVEFLGETAVSINAPDEGFGHAVECIIGVEQKPLEYITIQHVTFPDGSPEKVFASAGGFESILMNIFDRMKGQRLGAVHARKRFRTLGGKGKHTIRQIVIVDPKKPKNINLNGQTLNVDWSHRWEVRGHYRKIDGLGKDPSGRYCVEGYTYVKPHVRGPEDKPLIKNKVRIVK